jgi:hypothetical protein
LKQKIWEDVSEGESVVEDDSDDEEEIGKP